MKPAPRARSFLVAGLVLGLVSACGDDEPDAAIDAGPHSDLACAECHTTPATDGFVAAVTPGSCNRCHDEADLAADVEVHSVRLTHLTHPDTDGEGSLGCVACHTHESGAVDLDIATGSCFVCHADLPDATGAEATIAEADCAGCHVQPTHTGFATSGAPIDHGAVLERGISCLLCHYDVAEGTGAVTRASCRTCHGLPGGAQPLRGNESLAQADVHAVHMDTTIVMSCTRCHEPVNHSVIRLASSLVLDCESCHAPGDPALASPIDSTAHHTTQQLYAGLDPHHPDVEPALKFIERVSCAGCHGDTPTPEAGGSPARLTRIRQECNACHGSRFGPLLDPWIAGMRSNTALVGGYVRAAAAHPRVTGNASADSMADEAVAVWQHVADADGVHNIPAADVLLRNAVDAAAGAYRRVGLSPPARPALGPDPTAVSCVRCHYGVQTITRPVQSQTFSHDEHVVAGRVACNRCHGPADLFREDGTTFDPAHGGTRITPADCATCHHVDRATDCATCHTRAEVDALRLRADLTVHIQRDDIERTRTATFSHDAHGTLECAECHQAGPSQAAIGCNECHESHHGGLGAATTCTTCHGSDVLSRHQQVDHLICGACHAPATLSLLESADRRFCLQCHTTMADHNPEGECSTCHLLLTPDEAMQQIVNARTIPRGRE